MLTHLYPTTDGHDMRAICARQYRGRVILAEDGMVIQVRHGQEVSMASLS
jgi:hypothetical protein